MKSATSAKHSVHYVVVNTAPKSKARLVCDVGPRKGIQHITIWARGKRGPAQVRVIGRNAYFKGTAFTMHVFFGILKAQAKEYAGRWIFVPHSSPAFKPIAADVTFPSFAADLFPANGLSLVTKGKLIGVHGTAHNNGRTVTETLFAPAHGTPLPAKESATHPGYTDKDRLTIGPWNVKFHVPVPKNAIPIEVMAGG